MNIMSVMIRFFIFIAVVFFPHLSEARPVSYPGGWTLMTMNNKDMNALHLHYTPNPKNSIGWRHEYVRGQIFHVDAVQHNYLIKRWNGPASQANFYLKSGVGASYDSEEQGAAAFTGIAMDWEDRRYFTSYENRFFWTDKHARFANHKARVGIAPYVGDYGDLHTWLMVEADYQPDREETLYVTPLVRFFKGPTLLEAGYNFKGGALLNFVQRF